MDPSNPASFNHRTEVLSTGKKYHFVDQIPANYNPDTTPTLLCVHGFPDIWYSWRFVIIPWVEKCGWRVVAPDMLGYGGTDKPTDLQEYSLKSLCADLNALLDIIGVKRAVLVGHDWGATVSWRFALWYPERISALVTLSVPYNSPKSTHVPLEEIVKRLPNLKYQLYLRSPTSTKDIENNIVLFLTYAHAFVTDPDSVGLKAIIAQGRSASESYLTPGEFDYYVENFRQGGMDGPLNYYRTRDINFKEELEAKLPKSIPTHIPVLFMYGDKDRTCAQSSVEASIKSVPQMRVFELFNVGHWVPVQAHETVSTAVAEFVRSTLRHTGARM